MKEQTQNKKTKRYAIIDVETTGGVRLDHRMTEIAVLIVEEGEVLETWQTLINPERHIPARISHFTGIDNAMVDKAPKFYEIAKKLVLMTEGCVFVAHNVMFDYRFICNEFKRLGYDYARERLCTVRLARKAFPGLKSYSLGKLCKDLNIDLKQAHRAFADAQATTELFCRVAKEQPLLLSKNLSQMKRIEFPNGMDSDAIYALPEKPGVYYFLNEDNQIVYVGKSKHIRTRVLSHFGSHLKGAKSLKLKRAVHRVDHVLTGSDLAAMIWECEDIKHHRPMFNRAMNRVRFHYKIGLEADKEGFLHLQVRSRSNHETLKLTGERQDEIPVKSEKSAQKIIEGIYRKAFAYSEILEASQQLKLLKKHLKLESYNKRLQTVFDQQFYPHPNFKVTLPGRAMHETCCIWVQDYRLSHLSFEKKGVRLERKDLNEDIDMKRIFLSALQTLNSNSIEVLSEENTYESDDYGF